MTAGYSVSTADVEQRLSRTCRELIDIESVSRNEADVEAYIRRALPASFKLVYDNDSVLFALPERRSDKSLVVLAGHTDTVPVDNNLPSHVEQSVIFGRGASDMKSGIAVMIEMARWIDEEDIDTNVDLGFLFFGREELAAKECPLLQALADPVFDGIELALLMEPTGNTIEAGCMGNLNLTIRFPGVAAHSARPWLGTNAVNESLRALAVFAKLEPVPVIIDGLTYTEVASITGARAGVARNVIPASAEYDINIRYAPSRNPGDAETQWRDYFEELGAQVEIISNSPPADVVVDHPFIKQMRAAGVRSKQAWTNAADFSQRGIAAVNFGPGDPAFAHTQNEQVSIGALGESLRVLKRFVTEAEK